MATATCKAMHMGYGSPGRAARRGEWLIKWCYVTVSALVALHGKAQHTMEVLLSIFCHIGLSLVRHWMGGYSSWAAITVFFFAIT